MKSLILFFQQNPLLSICMVALVLSFAPIMIWQYKLNHDGNVPDSSIKKVILMFLALITVISMSLYLYYRV